jgi:integrase
MAEEIPVAISLRAFFAEHMPVPTKPSAAKSLRLNVGSSIAHLESHLGRQPSTADLKRETLHGLAERMLAAGRKPITVQRILDTMLRLSRVAHSKGLAAPMDRLKLDFQDKRQPHSLRPEQIEKLLAACLNTRTPVAGMNGAHWWLALLVTMINVEATVEQLLGAKECDWGGGGQRLTIDGRYRPLHPLAQECLARLQLQPSKHVTDRLFPWDLDRGEPPYHSFYNHFKTLTIEAGLGSDVTPSSIRSSAKKYGGRNLLQAMSMERLAFLAAELATAKAHAQAEANQGRKVEKIVRRKRKTDGRGKSQRFAHIVTLRPHAERTLRNVFLYDYQPNRMPLAKDGSILKHLQAINKLADFRGCDVTIDQLSDELIEGFMRWLVAGGRQAISANSLRAALLAQWNFIYQRKLIDVRPGYIKKLRVPKRVPVAWTVEELNCILSAAAGMPGFVVDVRAADWWVALILTVYDTGLRIGAALALRTEWLDLRSGYLWVPAEVQKQNADQTFKLAPDTLAALDRINPARRDVLFASTHDRHELCNWYRVILQRAGLPHGEKDLFHKLRRTSASYIARYGGTLAATEHLGHSSARVTGHYLDPRISRQQQAVELLPRPNWNKSGT